MSGFLDSDVQAVPGVSGAQGRVQQSVADTLSSLLGGDNAQFISDAFAQLLSGGETDIADIEAGVSRQFTRDIIPAINASASKIGAVQNTRRTKEIAQTGEDLSARLAQLRAQYKENFRNRQLQAIGLPLQIGAGFSTQRTMDNIVEPSLFSQFMELGGTLGGAALGKP